MRKKHIALLLACILTASILAGCGNRGPMMEKQAETVVTAEMMKAEKGEFVITQDYVGTVEASSETYIYPGTSGEIVELAVSEGDFVNAGDLLFRQDDESAKLTLKNAEAGYNQTQANANKTLNSQQKAAELSEQQNIDSLQRNINDKAALVGDAQANYNDALEDYNDAQEDEDSAENKYKKAKKKYNKAKEYADSWEALKDGEPGFSGMTLKEAANASPGEDDSNPAQKSISSAKSLLNSLENDNLSSSDITSEGLAALKSDKDSKSSAYESAKNATENVLDTKDSMQRSVDSANRSLESAYASKDNAVESQTLNNGEGLEDTKKVLDAQLASSEVSVESARYQVEQCTTTAPVSGTIDSLDISVHDTVGSNSSVMTIVNKDILNVVFSVSETVRNNLSIGQTVTITKDGRSISANIVEIDDGLDQSKGLFEVKAAVDGGCGLLTGTTCSVSIDSYRDNSGIVIPYDSVYYSNGSPYVFIEVEGVAQKIDVETGMFNSDSIVITKGLKVGDNIITTWSSDLKNGVKVQAKEEGV